MAISEATPAVNTELAATGSEYRYRVPKICDRAESAKAEAEVRLKFDGPDRCLPSPRRMRNLDAGQISTLRRRSEGGEKKQ
jgi:hypothetical protein